MEKIRVRGIILKDNGIIVIKRIREKNGTLRVYYVFPGGGVETGEDLNKAMHREVKEELGIEIEIIRQQYIERDEENNTNYFMLCKIKSGEIGTGIGPEYTDESYKNNGLYIPMIMSKKQLKDESYDLVPKGIRNKLIRDLESLN